MNLAEVADPQGPVWSVAGFPSGHLVSPAGCALSRVAWRGAEGRWREIRPRPQRGTSLIVEACDAGFTTLPMMFAP